MKTYKILIVCILLFAIVFSSMGCTNTKVNLQSAEEAIEYLEDYVEKNDGWSDIADELGLYYSVKGSAKFGSASTAEKQHGNWVVILQGFITGSTDSSNTNGGTFEFAYFAVVTPDGQVSGTQIKKIG